LNPGLPGDLRQGQACGQNLSLHPHVHAIVPGGGLSPQGKWRRAKGKGKFLFPVKAMSIPTHRDRGKFVAGLRQLRQAGKLAYPGGAAKLASEGAWQALKNSCPTAGNPTPTSPSGSNGPQTISPPKTTLRADPAPAEGTGLGERIQRIAVEQEPLDHVTIEETGHGRFTSWTAYVFDAQDSPKAKEWANLRRVIHIHRFRIEKGKETHTNSFYISDRFETSAEYYCQGIRGHWGIENRLHYVKDVVHKEDHNRIKTGTGPIAFAVFSTVAINIHRKQGFQSITEAQDHAIANISDLFCLIST